MYESFLANLGQFREMNALQTPIFFKADESAVSLAMQNAYWHKSCHLNYNNSMLAKAKKRSACMNEHDPDKKSSKSQAIANENCLFVVFLEMM